MTDKTIDLDKVLSSEKRQELAKLNIGDKVTLQGVKYKVEKRFSNGEKQAATLIPV
jgi:hypothetical protein